MDSICRFVSDDDGSLEIFPLRFVYETELKKFPQPLLAKSYRFMIVSDGEASLSHGGEKTPISRGSVCFFMPESSFYLDMSASFRVIYLDFNSPGLEKYFISTGVDLCETVLHSQDFLLACFDDAIKRVHNYNSTAIMTAVALYALSTLIYSIKESCTKKVSRDSFDAISDFVNTAFNDPMMSLKKLEERFSYSKKHLSRLFKKNLGVGFNKYLNSLRLNYAKTLADEGVGTVKDIAYASGFLDQLYFSRAFKNYFGVTPRDYIKNSPLRKEREFFNKYNTDPRSKFKN